MNNGISGDMRTWVYMTRPFGGALPRAAYPSEPGGVPGENVATPLEPASRQTALAVFFPRTSLLEEKPTFLSQIIGAFR